MNYRDSEKQNSGVNRRYRGHREWFCLLPIVAAFIICYLRFPLFQNDDHQPVIEYIARTGAWPDVLEYRSSMHSLVYHTAAAGVYRLLKWGEPFLTIPSVRAGQLINLLGMGGIAILVIFILRRLLPDLRARIFALLVFGSSTRWIIAAVTIDNDTLMALAATAALLLTIAMIKRRERPSWALTLLIAAIIGVSATIKENGLQFFLPLSGCIIARHWIYRERFCPLLGRVAAVWAVAILVMVPIHVRHYRDTGKIIYHDQGFHQKNWSGSRWEFFTFRFGEILRRPALPYADVADERLCPADLSWPSKIYMNWWSLPDSLPDRPSPGLTAAIFVSALPLTLLFLIGIGFAVRQVKFDPAWLAVLGWFGIVIFSMLAASLLFPEPRWACHTYPRHVLGGAGGIIALTGLAFEKITLRWPRSRYILYLLLAIHLVIFWRLLLSGPFYSLYYPWPKYNI